MSDYENNIENNNDKDKKKHRIQDIIIIILILIIIILLLTRCGALDEFIGNHFPKDNTETNVDVDKNDNDKVNNNLNNDDYIPIDNNALDENNKTNSSSQAEETGENYNKFIGYSDVVVNNSYPTLELKNDSFNISYAKYTIYNNGIKIFETNLIAPGKHVNWNVVDTLKEKGTYNLIQACSFYDVTFDDNGNIISQVQNGTTVNNSSLKITIE